MAVKGNRRTPSAWQVPDSGGAAWRHSESASVQAVPRGQTEAARSLGMSPGRAMISIVLPPPLTNELILLAKESALVDLLGLTLMTSAWLMLQRNLLYTAVTRAKRLVVLVGSRRAPAKAVRTQGAGRRYTPHRAATADEDHGLSRPSRWAIAAASPRPVTPSLARILETWTLAVLGVMNSCWPIWRLVRPAATRPVLRLRARSARGRRAPMAGPIAGAAARQLGNQARLADTGLAPHKDDGRFSICGPHPGRLQELELLDAADEGRAHDTAARLAGIIACDRPKRNGGGKEPATKHGGTGEAGVWQVPDSTHPPRRHPELASDDGRSTRSLEQASGAQEGKKPCITSMPG